MFHGYIIIDIIYTWLFPIAMLVYQGVTKKLWWCHGGAWTILLAGFAYSSIFCHLIWFDSLLVRPMCAINLDVSSRIWMCIAYLHPFLEANGVPVRAKNVPLQYGFFLSGLGIQINGCFVHYTHYTPAISCHRVCFHVLLYYVWSLNCSCPKFVDQIPTRAVFSVVASLFRWHFEYGTPNPQKFITTSAIRSKITIFRETHAHYSLVQSPQSPCFTENHHPIQHPKFRNISIIPNCFLIKTKSRNIYSFIHFSSPNSVDFSCCFVTRLYHLFSIARENHSC